MPELTVNAASTKPPAHRAVHLSLIGATPNGHGRYLATNPRGGVLPIGSGEDPDFTPVELLLAAIAGCSAVDVHLITRKRADALDFQIDAAGETVRDSGGNHLTGLRVTFDVTFPEGPEGDAARAALPRALVQTRDRLCTVGRTVALGEDIAYEVADAR